MPEAITFKDMPNWAKVQFEEGRGLNRREFVGFLNEATAQPETVHVRLRNGETIRLMRGPMD